MRLLQLSISLACFFILDQVATQDNQQYPNQIWRRRTQWSTNNRQRSSRTVSDASKWPNRVIPYEVGRSMEQYQGIINQAIREIETRTCIRFRKRQRESDYIVLYNGRGCHSKVGRAGGRQTVSLGRGCHDVGSVLHELCHAIGLYHEHMRYDRDEYLQIQWSNIQPSMYDQFQKIPAWQYKPASNFDYKSIMIYGSKAFTKNGRKTMIPRKSRQEIVESHFKQHLADSDVLNINSFYGC